MGQFLNQKANVELQEALAHASIPYYELHSL